jgi:NADPH2:quinone reductase
MRAAQVTRLDGPAGVEVVDIDEPVPADGQVLVDVYAVGISFPDLLLARGEYQLKPDLPFTLGIDFAGVVRSDPSGGFAAGDRVAGWGPSGGATEVVAAAPTHLFPLPDNLSVEQGACLPLNYLTAHYALVTRGGLRPGATVLVHGAAGGLGSAAVHLASALGARVFGVVSSPDRAAAARAAGAAEVLLTDDFATGARTLTHGTGVNLVLDMVGGDRRAKDSLRCLAPLGRMLVLGFAGGAIGSVQLNRPLLNNTEILGVAWGPYTRLYPDYPRAQWNELLPLMRDGSLAPSVGRVYPLEDVATALSDLADRRAVGKSVLSLR